MKPVITQAAREDILRQFQYYLIDEGNERAAERFLEAVQAAVAQVCQHPRIGVPKHLQNPRLAGLRSWPVKGYPDMRVYYLDLHGLLRVVRMLHGKRDIHALLEASE